MIKDTKPIVSFIVPVYKVEPYIHQCVDSLLVQTYSNFEIVLVDDGSPDNCPAICDDYASKDTRIRVIHKLNGGLSDARNVGAKNACGEYIVFVDSDDFWCDKDCLNNLVSHKHLSEVDFIGFNGSYYFPSTEKYFKITPYSDSLSNPIDGSTALNEMVKTGLIQISACFKIIRRDFFIQNELFFVKGQTGEDIPWFINMLDACDKCCFVNDYIYAYRKGLSDSISSMMDEKHFLSLFNIFKNELSKVEERSFSKESKDALKSFLAYEYCILLTYNVSHDLRKELYGYKQILSYSQHPKVKKASKIYKLGGIRITACFLKLYMKLRSYRMK